MAITQELIDKTETNLTRWDDIVNEDENGTTTLDNALVVKSLAGYLAEFKSYNILGAWQTGYSYSIKDVAKESGNHYICLEAHTSGTFSTDLSSGKWGLFQVDFSNLTATGSFTGTFTGDLTGSVLQASQTNITAVGTLTSLEVSGDIFAGGNIGINETSPSSEVSGSAKVLHIKHNNLASLRLENTSQKSYEIFSGTAGQLSFRQDGSEKMQIPSTGGLAINNTIDMGGQTTGHGFLLTGNSQLVIAASGQTVAYWNRTDSSGGTVHDFRLNGVTKGSISVSPTATSYNTSSDYRLKENVTPLIDGVSRVMKLKPCRFNFLEDKNQTVDGFLAHEVQGIIPEAVTGEKDAVDEEGNPEYQAIDQSKIVPLLVASVQELKKELDALKK